MMGDVIDFYKECGKELKKQDQLEREENRNLASGDWGDAQRLAAKHGMILRRHTDVHYRLIGPGKAWAINIYPGNRRIYNPPGPKRGPYLKLPLMWTLLDVVKKAIEHEGRA
jgi:hypothetical protein